MEGERCRQLSVALVLGGTALWGIACSGADSLSPSRVATIRIVTGAALQLAPGDSYHLTAVAADAGGSPVEGVRFVWRSEDASVATVDGSGLVTAQGPGSA
ncbi:MAG TPA: Ig-like domain-containing protein, partial [Gemmatimonadales bacterium]|nr:Ig-like domain-containing protein [Gemmatimonadales bacterium]